MAKIKLSSTQIRIIEILQEKPGRYIKQFAYMYGQEVREPNGDLVKCFRSTTLDVLKKLNVVVPNQNKTGYILSSHIPKL